MENILEVYQRSYDETHPLICMDESSKQHLKETRQPIPAQPGSVEKYDTEYERNGVSPLSLRDRSRVVPRSDRACVFTKRFFA